MMLTITRAADGLYVKSRGKYGGKTYYGVCNVQGKARMLKGMCRTATLALEYSKRVADRYSKMLTGVANAYTLEQTSDPTSESGSSDRPGDIQNEEGETAPEVG